MRTLPVCLLLLASCGRDDPPAPAQPPPPPVDLRTGRFTLALETQRYLFEIENRYHVLQERVARRLGRALRAGDPAPWLACLAPGFFGGAFEGKGALHEHGAVFERSFDGGRDAIRRLDGAVWVKNLLGLAAGFERLDVASVHFDNLSPKERGSMEGPWTGTWTLRFAGRWRGRRVEGEFKHELRYARVTKDMDRETGWLLSCRPTRAWWRGTGAVLMKDATASSGIDISALVDTWTDPIGVATTGAYLLDFDRDGRLDLLLLDATPHLYKSLGDGRFEERTERLGLPKNRRLPWAATVADLDNDGYEDLLMDFREPDGSWVAEIYRNRGDGSFRRLEESEFTLPPGIVVGNGAVADFDGDGRTDLYFRNAGAFPEQRKQRWIGDWSHKSGVLLRNLGSFRFSDVTKKAGASAGHRDIFAAVWLDVEPDGDPDLFLGHHFGENLLLENRGDKTFVEHVLGGGFGGFTMGADAGDLDGDGDPDLYLANMASRAGHRIFANLQPGDFPPGGHYLIMGFVTGNSVLQSSGAPDPSCFKQAGLHTAGWAYGPALIDLDGDGWLDIYVPAGFQSVERGKPDG